MKKVINWFEKNSDVSWIIVIGIMAIIFSLSSFGGLGTSSKGDLGIFSIIYHFFAFFFLNLFLLFSLVRGNRKEFILVAVIISIFYGITDEFHQYFVPGRVSDFFDIMVNNVGVFFSTLFYMFFLRNNRLCPEF